jgi:UDP-N-acetylmuramate dehydrogenase
VMNAGAYGTEVGDLVSWVRLARGGRVDVLDGSELSWGYRSCRELAGGVVLEVGLRLQGGERKVVAERRREIACKRGWQKGLRCCGSVFCNPPGQYAGEIIEKAGLKGCRIGGAQVCSEHANFIVAGSGATASDVLALIRRVERDVLAGFGVRLRREVRVWERCDAAGFIV